MAFCPTYVPSHLFLSSSCPNVHWSAQRWATAASSSFQVILSISLAPGWSPLVSIPDATFCLSSLCPSTILEIPSPSNPLIMVFAAHSSLGPSKMSMVCPEGQPASQVAPSPVVVGPGAGAGAGTGVSHLSLAIPILIHTHIIGQHINIYILQVVGQVPPARGGAKTRYDSRVPGVIIVVTLREASW